MGVTTISGNLIVASIVDVSLTPAEVAAATAAAETFTVPGVKTTDSIIVNPPAQAGSVGPMNAYASAANTVSIQFCNPTAGALTPDAGTYKIIVLRPEGLSGASKVTT